MKKCNRCKIPKVRGEYYKNSHALDGLKSICKKCTSEAAKKYYIENLEQVKEYHRNHHLKNKEKNNKRNRERFHNNPELKKRNRLRPYGITQEYLDGLMLASNNKCNICGLSRENHIELYNKDLYIDHCHKTNKVRGILCHKCNLALGYFNDDLDLLDKAKNYLLK